MPKIYSMNDEPSTPDQHELIRIRAAERVNFILWLAARLRREQVPQVIRRAAADELEMLVGK